MNRISICVCSWVAWYISYHVLLTPGEYRNGISAYICTFGLWNIAIIWTSQFGPLGCCSKCCCNCSRWRNECSNRCGNWNKRQVGPNCIRHTQYQATRSSEDRAASTRGMGLTFLCSFSIESDYNRTLNLNYLWPSKVSEISGLPSVRRKIRTKSKKFWNALLPEGIFHCEWLRKWLFIHR